MDDIINLRTKVKDRIPVPPANVFAWDRAVYLQRAFGDLIGNEDRDEGDVLITKDWETILIDHSRTFRTTRKFTRCLIFSGGQTANPKPVKELPRAFVDKVRTLDFATMKKAVGEYLTRQEIDSVLARREVLLGEIDGEINRRGEKSVLY